MRTNRISNNTWKREIIYEFCSEGSKTGKFGMYELLFLMLLESVPLLLIPLLLYCTDYEETYWIIKSIQWALNALFLTSNSYLLITYIFICSMLILVFASFLLILILYAIKIKGNRLKETKSAILTANHIIWHMVLVSEKISMIILGIIFEVIGNRKIEYEDLGEGKEVENDGKYEELFGNMSGGHIAGIIIGIMSIFLLSLLIGLHLLFIEDWHPNSRFPWNFNYSTSHMLLWLIKFTMILLWVIDPLFHLKLLHTIPILLLILLYLIYYVYHPPRSILLLSNIALLRLLFIVLIYISSLSNGFNLGYGKSKPIYSLPRLAIYAIVFCWVIYLLSRKDLLKENFISIKEPTKGLNLVEAATKLLYDYENWECCADFHYMLIAHANSCLSPDCAIRNLADQNQNDIPLLENDVCLNNNYSIYKIVANLFRIKSSSLQRTQEASSRSKTSQLIMSLFNELELKFPREIQVKITKAYYCAFVFGKTCSALGILSQISLGKISFKQKYMIYEMRKRIEEIHIRSYKKQEEEGDFGHINSVKIIEKERNFGEFMDNLIESSSAGQIFWQSLCKDSIDNLSVKVLKNMGNILMRSIRKTEYYGNLLLNNKSLSNYPSFLLKYLFFCKYISNNYKKFIYTEQLLQYATKGKLKNIYADGEGSKCLLVSGELETLGEISGASYDIEDLLGYSKQELFFKNINLLIPKIFQKSHFEFMLMFLSSMSFGDRSPLKEVLIKHKSGFLLKLNLQVKTIPQFLNKKFQFLCLLSPIELNAYKAQIPIYLSRLQIDPIILYCSQSEDNYHLLGFSRTCSAIGISPHLLTPDAELLEIGDLIYTYKYDLSEYIYHFNTPKGEIFEMNLRLLQQFMEGDGDFYELEGESAYHEMQTIKEEGEKRTQFMFWGKMHQIEYKREDISIKLVEFILFRLSSQTQIDHMEQYVKHRDEMALEEEFEGPVISEINIPKLADTPNQMEEDPEKMNLVRHEEKSLKGEKEEMEDFKLQKIKMTIMKSLTLISLMAIFSLAITYYVIVRDIISNTKHSYELLNQASQRFGEMVVAPWASIEEIAFFLYLQHSWSEEDLQGLYESYRGVFAKYPDKTVEVNSQLLQNYGNEDKEIRAIEEYVFDVVEVKGGEDGQKAYLHHYELSLTNLVTSIANTGDEIRDYMIIYNWTQSQGECGGETQNNCYLRKLLNFTVINALAAMPQMDRTIDQYIDIFLGDLGEKENVLYVCMLSFIALSLFMCAQILFQAIILNKRQTKVFMAFAFIPETHLHDIIINLLSFQEIPNNNENLFAQIYNPSREYLGDKCSDQEPAKSSTPDILEFTAKDSKIQILSSKEPVTNSITPLDNGREEDLLNYMSNIQEDNFCPPEANENIEEINELSQEETELISNQNRKISQLKKESRGVISKILLSFICILISLGMILFPHIYISSSFFRLFEDASNLFNILSKRPYYLELVSLSTEVAMMYQTYDILDNSLDEHNFNYYFQRLMLWEKKLIEFERSNNKLYPKLSKSIKDYNEGEKYQEYLKTQTIFDYDIYPGCTTTAGGIAKNGLRATIYAYLNKYNTFRLHILDKKDTEENRLIFDDVLAWSWYIYECGCTGTLSQFAIFIDETKDSLSYYESNAFIGLISNILLFVLLVLCLYWIIYRLLHAELADTLGIITLIQREIVRDNLQIKQLIYI